MKKIRVVGVLWIVLALGCGQEVAAPPADDTAGGGEVVRFLVSFDPNGGEWPDAEAPTRGVTDENGTVAAPALNPAYGQYVFSGWVTQKYEPLPADAEVPEEEFLTTETVVTESCTVYALWKEKPVYTRTIYFFKTAGEPFYDQQFVSANTGFALQKPLPSPGSKEHHTSDGKWYTQPAGGTEFTPVTVVQEDEINVYAHWFPNTYLVYYYAEIGAGIYYSEVLPYPNLTLGALPDAPEKDGYLFEGWFPNQYEALLANEAKPAAGQIFGGELVTHNMTLYALWRVLPQDMKHVRFYQYEGGPLQTTLFAAPIWDGVYILDVALPQPAARAHYTSDGKWYTADGGTISRNMTVTDDMDVYPRWIGERYVAYFHTNGGNGSEPLVNVVYPNPLGAVFPQTARAGYVLRGWYTRQFPALEVYDEMPAAYAVFAVTQDTVITENIHVYALWQRDE
ncbi:MAG: InlB B-repeat-containing protein [Spirochaetaceae bacterium]|jgi:hypothetical protein|nr:InlB B-repeat-containing protein [Spirochaetaceae bacterium]